MTLVLTVVAVGWQTRGCADSGVVDACAPAPFLDLAARLPVLLVGLALTAWFVRRGLLGAVSVAGMSGTDPEPERTSDLEPGGGVSPGATPPAETSATAGLGEKQPDLPSRRTNAVVYGVIVAVVLIVALLFVGYAVGLFD